MLSQLTAMQRMVHGLSRLQDAGALEDEHAAREPHGGNGILLSHDVARFVADAEAIYSYEGTKQVNSLIVGRAVTGFSAFV
jgi:glutaryl-CoA dehydrogenase